MDAIWELDWDRLQGIRWMTGRAQSYLYLVGYTCNLPEPKLVKIPIMANHEFFASHIWAWLQRFMAGQVEALPAPKIIKLPQKPSDVLMRYGGRLVMWSITTRKGRRSLPLMISVDLAILLLYMPSRALPQLIILQYPEIRFPEENVDIVVLRQAKYEWRSDGTLSMPPHTRQHLRQFPPPLQTSPSLARVPAGVARPLFFAIAMNSRSAAPSTASTCRCAIAYCRAAAPRVSRICAL